MNRRFRLWTPLVTRLHPQTLIHSYTSLPRRVESSSGRISTAARSTPAESLPGRCEFTNQFQLPRAVSCDRQIDQTRLNWAGAMVPSSNSE